MKCTCPECKNDVDMSRYASVTAGTVIECDSCGITLLVKGVDGEEAFTEIVDEGK
jgi:DNA-directed RNA polymerase subunit RPC12/RpoP